MCAVWYKSFDNALLLASVKTQNILVGLCTLGTLSISMKTVMSFLGLIWNFSSGDQDHSLFCVYVYAVACRGAGGVWGVQTHPLEFRRSSKIVPNSTRLWKLLKTAEFRTPIPQYVRKKGSKILKLSRFAIVLR